MAAYISALGSECLRGFRLGPPLKPVGRPTATHPLGQQLAALPSEECGCPEEIWVASGIIVLIHFEEDGTAEAHFDGGDWTHEMNLGGVDMPALRDIALRWIANVPVEDPPC